VSSRGSPLSRRAALVLSLSLSAAKFFSDPSLASCSARLSSSFQQGCFLKPVKGHPKQHETHVIVGGGVSSIARY